MKHKVVHMSTVHHPLDTRIIYKECMSLKDVYDTYFVCSNHKDIKGINNFYGIQFIKIKKRKNRFLRIILSTIDAYRATKQINADIFHLHDPELLLIAPFLKRKGKEVIYDMHEDYETSIQQKEYLPDTLKKIISFSFNLLEKSSVKRYQLVLAEKYYLDKYPNGTPILNYPIISSKNFSAYKPKSKKLLYTGNVTKDRGALEHAEILNYTDEIQVTFVGYCSHDLANIIKSTVKDTDRISIVGEEEYIPREKIDKIYQQQEWLAGLAIFPYSEHYKQKELTKFFEYMNVGLPIIASDFSSWKEFINLHRCGIVVNPNSQEEIKTAINYLANNPKEAKLMGQNGMKAVETILNWSNESNKLINLYTRLLNKDTKKL